ncbi:MAG TPA: histidine kinase dimerization/phospho-acceptor domain-containing protein, partial [Polyangiales bacterium]
MSAKNTLTVRAFAVAIATPLVVTLLKLTLFEALGRLPFLLYFVAVLISTWSGGLWAGLISTALAAVVSGTLFLPHLPIGTVQQFAQLRLITFVVEAATITFLTARLRNVSNASAQAANDAKLSLAKLEGVLAGVTHGIVMQNEHGDLVYANDLAAQGLGLPDAATLLATKGAELLRPYRLLTPEGGELTPEQLPAQRVLRGEVATTEQLVRMHPISHGEERWSLMRASAVCSPDGKVQYAVTVIQDLTEQRRREQAQRAEDRRRTFLSDATRELNSSLDYRRTLAVVARLAVPAMADWCVVDLWEGDRLVRLAAEHVDPSQRELLFEMDRRYPVDASAHLGRAEVMRTDKPVMVPAIPPDELSRYAQDEGHAAMLRRLSLHGFIVVPLHAHGVTLGLISLVMAGSKRVHGESELALAVELAERAGLAIAHARAYGEAEQARRDAEEANRAKDEFLAMLGHELRNPLSPIVTAVHLMKMRRADLFERERTIIERQVRHLVTLVDDLLDVSRITRGKVELNKEAIDLNDTVARALELAAPLIEQRKHEVDVA